MELNNNLVPGWRGNKITRIRKGARIDHSDARTTLRAWRGKAEGKPEGVIKSKRFCRRRQCDSSFYHSRVAFVTEQSNIQNTQQCVF